MTFIPAETGKRAATKAVVPNWIYFRRDTGMLYGRDVAPGEKERDKMEGYRWKAAVVTLSDKGYAGEREDKSGPLICEMIAEAGYDVQKTVLLPDEKDEIKKYLCLLCDIERMDIIFTTGGTGFAPRDCTPEATLEAADRIAPGIAEAMRLASLRITPRAMLSRGVSVIRGQTLIINLPGSPKAVRENLEAVLPSLDHGLAILTARAGECAR
ncbi:MogA/MoaB family molybdenum cofactor biosynthesis protein [[Ruminococcus] torques]|nr:MogA/MoaB family molybdenum cofactor biosynthesis protein [[Ruminococcus] torques]MDM8234824.1 MogA/MoaB family molybdenum cofactor biosynthesis protein [[Ruminococcus] torques]